MFIRENGEGNAPNSELTSTEGSNVARQAKVSSNK